MNNNENPFFDKKVQDVLNKLISEEMLANQMYHIAVMTAKAEAACQLFEMFKTIADDELYDHHKELCQFAIANGYSIPVQEKEYKKYASKECWKLYDSLKKDQDVQYYIDQAIKSEIDAIQSYDEALKDDSVPYELHATIQKNYYDEIEHLENLRTLFVAAEANANLVWTSSYETANALQKYWW